MNPSKTHLERVVAGKLVHVRERVHHGIGSSQSGMRIGGCNSDYLHRTGSGRSDARSRVFEHQAIAGIKSQKFGTLEIWFGRGLALVDVIRGDKARWQRKS